MDILERDFQEKLIKDLKRLFPGCVILKNDSQYKPGILDLTILYGPRWAVLECKKNAKAPARPLQPYYQQRLNQMSFAAFIYPENRKEVLDALQTAFGA